MALTPLNPNPVRQTDSTGTVAPGALLYTYAAGTTSNQATYTDATGSTPLSNPVVADASGLFPQVWLSALSYDFYCYTSAGTLLWQSKGIAPTSTTAGFTPISVTGTDTIVGTFSPGISFYQTGQQFQFQAVGNNATTTVSVNISGLGPIPVYHSDGSALAVGDIKANQLVQLYYTGSFFQYFLADRSASWLFAEAGGSANALTASFTPTVTSLSHGQIVYVRAASANTGAATFQADATTARSIYKGANQALLPGDIAGAGHLLILRRDATLNKYELLNPARGLSDSAAPGTVKMFAGETPPAGWMELDGSSLVMAAYPDLYAAIGTLHGSADGTHFNLPDMRGVFPRGWSHGTTANDPDVAGRTAAATGGATGDHVGSKQGWQIQSHNHLFYASETSTDGSAPDVERWTGYKASSYTTSYTGDNQTNPVNINLMFIIKY